MATPRNADNKRHSTALRLPADLLDALDTEATDRMLGRNKLVELLLRDALGRLHPPSLVHASTCESDHATDEPCMTRDGRNDPDVPLTP